MSQSRLSKFTRLWMGSQVGVLLLVLALVSALATRPAAACSVFIDFDLSRDLAEQRALWDKADSVVLARVDRRDWISPDHAWLTWHTLVTIKGGQAPASIHRIRHVSGFDRNCGFFPPNRGDVAIFYLRRNDMPIRLIPTRGWSVIGSEIPRFSYDPRVAEGLRAAASRLRSGNQ